MNSTIVTKLKLTEDGELDRNFKPGTVVRDFTGRLFLIKSFSQEHVTTDLIVMYESLLPGKDGMIDTYAMNLGKMVSKVNKRRFPNAIQEYNFEIVEIIDDEKE